jgi:hypothetical protein
MTKKLLLVVGAGGPPMEYALPRLAELADVSALVMAPINKVQDDLLGRWCQEVRGTGPGGGDLGPADLIVVEAKQAGADAVIGFSEFTVMAVADACSSLGLPGAGPNAVYARDKYLMRARWADSGVPVPRFARVASVGELESAAMVLRKPFLLKPASRGGAIGQQVIGDGAVLEEAWAEVGDALARAAGRGIVEYSQDAGMAHYVAEEIIPSTTESWYGCDGYGDYLSVEGVVARGTYHPVCISGRLPTVPPFAETATIGPSVLPERLQRKIQASARSAVDALGLGTCGTHTEMKLMAGEEVCLLETSARFGGAAVVPQVEAIFGVDMISLLAAELLGEGPVWPPEMLVEGSSAAASVFVFGAGSRGEPWPAGSPFHWETLRWDDIVSPGTSVEVVRSQTVPDGGMVLPYEPGRGALNYAGCLLVRSASPEVLLGDSYRLIDGLGPALRGQVGERAAAGVVVGDGQP